MRGKYAKHCIGTLIGVGPGLCGLPRTPESGSSTSENFVMAKFSEFIF
jgi:hypothetical protein